MSEGAVHVDSEPRDPRGGSEPVIPEAQEGPSKPDWNGLKQTLPDDIRESPFMALNHQSLEDALRAASSQHRLVGMEKIARPKPDASKEDWATFYNALGRPETADKYDLGDFEPPEGLQWDTDLQKNMLDTFHKRGLTNDQVKGVMQDYAQIQATMARDQNEQMQQARMESENALREEWGNAYPRKAKMADEELSRVFGDFAPTVAKYVGPNGFMFGNDPEVIKGFHKLAQLHQEAQLIGEANVSEPSLSPAAAQAEIEAMESNPEIAKVLSKADPKSPEVKRWNMLYDFAHPEKVG